MENEKPKSIKTTGVIIAILSTLAIFSNGMGALMYTLLGMGKEQAEKAFETPIEFIFSHYVKLCLFMMVIGSVYLLGGLFLRKYKLWANRFVTSISVIQILIVWIIMLAIRSSIKEEPELGILSTWTIVVATFWSIPFGVLIWFLNRKETIKYFS